jgi:NADPH-dependent 2,4-dienoyl-CoA reductase/sulfur reductase-like enzyme
MIVVVGAGPAGIAAALHASERGAEVTVVDDNRAAGGQIWRGAYELRSPGVSFLPNARVVQGSAPERTVVAETGEGAIVLRYDKLILATGARELFLPFPGWTLPGTVGVGGLQALAKGGLPLRRKRVAVAGSGPLLLAGAAFFRRAGAEVVLIAEQASAAAVGRFAAGLARHPAKLAQAVALQGELLGVPYRLGCLVERAEGDARVERVWFRTGARRFGEDVDYAAIAWGLVPNTELAQSMGCGTGVDAMQRTAHRRIYCAGEATGIGGVDLSTVEGAIAGCAAAGDEDGARRLFARREKARAFARSVNRAFALRPELRGLPLPETIVCRCEDVPYEALRAARSFREAKLHTRGGMGPCQGRICGPATAFLLGWGAESVRPPVLPARAATLICSSQLPKGDDPECTHASRLPPNQET